MLKLSDLALHAKALRPSAPCYMLSDLAQTEFSWCAWQQSLNLQTFNSNSFPLYSPTRDEEEKEEEEEEEEERRRGGEVTAVGGECFQSEVTPLPPHWPSPGALLTVSRLCWWI